MKNHQIICNHLTTVRIIRTTNILTSLRFSIKYQEPNYCITIINGTKTEIAILLCSIQLVNDSLIQVKIGDVE